ncbi:protein-glutamate methylesterase/protein-glutamine glutaminase [Anaerobranca gottschalkii]|uniref:Protein-glutamate methylesterase/protein-glutamine glutaminase n=1 Tax=Anaerobranca gottschalkii DSM 13577 TaxID=1120990 RepID=A0A1I0CSZ1_9FIRM|nr:chemotaxis response regulator protein-glutamate methylesterase [Anaerobranca gottschalkii]SET22837.1 two-component system, chemotaxis family, response regulator CheB [Anaerobranca gottschalkii DSM 13577]
MVKVVIIDDSVFMRRVIKDILVKNGIEVIAEAENGFLGLKYVLELNPDVVLLDIEMPVLTGLDTLALIMKKKATPVIMFSTLTKEGANITMEALKLGAVDFLHKPNNSLEIHNIKEALVEKIKTAAKANIKKVQDSERKKGLEAKIQSKLTLPGKVNKICVIGCSTGGPKALTNIFENLKELKETILVVQHMPAFFTKTLAKRLDDITPYLVKEGEDNEEIKKGVVYLAPGDYHMTVEEQRGSYFLKLNKQPAIHGCRPAVDPLFKSVAPIFKDRVLGCILTGMGKDGGDGCEEIKGYGGKVYVESEETCTIYGMPKQVVERNLADKVLPINAFADEIREFLK